MAGWLGGRERTGDCGRVVAWAATARHRSCAITCRSKCRCSVPMGTENLLGRYRGTVDPTRRPFAARLTTAYRRRSIWAAPASYFLLMISAGFDAEVIRASARKSPGQHHAAVVFLPTLRTIRSYGYPQMRLYCRTRRASRTCERQPRRVCRWLFGFNLPLYALGIADRAGRVATDGLLDVCTFERGGVWSVARYLWHVLRRSHGQLPDATLLRSRAISLEATDAADVAYQVDGDYGGTLPVDVEVLPGQLRLLVSREAAAAVGLCAARLGSSGEAQPGRLTAIELDTDLRHVAQ